MAIQRCVGFFTYVVAFVSLWWNSGCNSFKSLDYFFFPNHTDNEQRQLSLTTGHLGRTKRYPKMNSKTWIFNCLQSKTCVIRAFRSFYFCVIKPCCCLFSKYFYELPSGLCLYHPFNLRLYYDIPSIRARLFPFVSFDNWLGSCTPCFSLLYTQSRMTYSSKKIYLYIVFLLSKLL